MYITGIMVDIQHQVFAEGNDIFLRVPSLAPPGGDNSGETFLYSLGFLQLTFGLETTKVLDGFLPRPERLAVTNCARVIT